MPDTLVPKAEIKKPSKLTNGATKIDAPIEPPQGKEILAVAAETADDIREIFVGAPAIYTEDQRAKMVADIVALGPFTKKGPAIEAARIAVVEQLMKTLQTGDLLFFDDIAIALDSNKGNAKAFLRGIETRIKKCKMDVYIIIKPNQGVRLTPRKNPETMEQTGSHDEIEQRNDQTQCIIFAPPAYRKFAEALRDFFKNDPTVTSFNKAKEYQNTVIIELRGGGNRVPAKLLYLGTNIKNFSDRFQKPTALKKLKEAMVQAGYSSNFELVLEDIVAPWTP